MSYTRVMTVTDDRPYATRPRSVRMHADAWDLIGGSEKDRSPFMRDMTEAGLDRARCFRCFALVEVEYGDLTGRPLAEWVALARKTVSRQHPHHRPIVVGAGMDTARPPAPRSASHRRSPAPVRFQAPEGGQRS